MDKYSDKYSDITDFDLDVKKILDDYPENDKDVCLYLRTEVERDEDQPGMVKFGKSSTALLYGKVENVPYLIVDAMLKAEPIRNAMLDAMLYYFKLNPGELPIFLRHLKESGIDFLKTKAN
jgi:hypothetical protein